MGEGDERTREWVRAVLGAMQPMSELVSTFKMEGRDIDRLAGAAEVLRFELRHGHAGFEHVVVVFDV